MGVLLIGATRADQGPSLDDEELPADVQDLIAGFHLNLFSLRTRFALLRACVRKRVES